MIKKDLNQNTKFEQELINTFEPDFTFGEKPLNRYIDSQPKNAKEI